MGSKKSKSFSTYSVALCSKLEIEQNGGKKDREKAREIEERRGEKRLTFLIILVSLTFARKKIVLSKFSSDSA